jgi:RNA recognition motif-containing protein
MSQSKIYVGNLSYDTTPEGVQEHFAQYGAIAEAKLITDRDTGRSRGFAFITYSEQQDAQSALAADGESLDGKALRVNMAKEDGGRGGRGGAGGRGGRW